MQQHWAVVEWIRMQQQWAVVEWIRMQQQWAVVEWIRMQQWAVVEWIRMQQWAVVEWIRMQQWVGVEWIWMQELAGVEWIRMQEWAEVVSPDLDPNGWHCGCVPEITFWKSWFWKKSTAWKITERVKNYFQWEYWYVVTHWFTKSNRADFAFCLILVFSPFSVVIVIFFDWK